MLASMLLVLHTALDAGFDTRLSNALMLAHLGLFFLWQPIWQREQRLDVQGIAVISVLAGGMLWLLNWPLVFAWLVLLIGIIAGRSFSTRQERYVYMLSLAFLVSELLVTCTVKLFLGHPLAPGLASTFRIGLYLLPAVLYAIPPITVPQREPFPVDFFRAITFALMTALLAVISVLMTLRLGIDYPFALVATLMALGLFLFFLSWIATPAAGSIGLLAAWEKSVLNIGTPFEAWLGDIANLARQRPQADAFLDAAIAELVAIPWVAGARWRTPHAHGESGQPSRHQLEVDTEGLSVMLFTERSFSTALVIHCRLLIQVLGHFYAAKLRENDQASASHLRAIYETGARVTHDIKNLLQSLNTMAGALAHARGPVQEQRSFDLLKRRLPDIAQRLQLALDKLQRPSALPQTRIPIAQWWEQIGQRFGDGEVQLVAAIDNADTLVPAECFDSIVDNLIDNARHKIAAGAARTLSVEVGADAGTAWCQVSDDGAAIAPELAARLLQQPVSSATGLGIGLYQAARQARLAGCELVLCENRDGRVSFAVRAAAAPA